MLRVWQTPTASSSSGGDGSGGGRAGVQLLRASARAHCSLRSDWMPWRPGCSKWGSGVRSLAVRWKRVLRAVVPITTGDHNLHRAPG